MCHAGNEKIMVGLPQLSAGGLTKVNDCATAESAEHYNAAHLQAKLSWVHLIIAASVTLVAMHTVGQWGHSTLWTILNVLFTNTHNK